MSAVAHFFMAVSGSFIHERMAQLFVDIYRSDNEVPTTDFGKLFFLIGLIYFFIIYFFFYISVVIVVKERKVQYYQWVF